LRRLAFANASVSLADGAPEWIKDLAVVNGDIVIYVKPFGTAVHLR